MNLEESKSPVCWNEISSSDDDKKFVSQGVAFVIGHTRNGFVSLCAGVASLLKEQAKLKQEITLLRNKLSALPHETNVQEDASFRVNQVSSSSIEKRKLPSQLLNYKKCKRKDLKIKKFRSLKECLCERCSQVPNAFDALCTPLEVGDKVVISGEICGSVQYVGHVDTLVFPEVFVGLLLDESVGDSNGTVGKKTYFSAPQGYGLFTPLYNVCCIIN